MGTVLFVELLIVSEIFCGIVKEFELVVELLPVTVILMVAVLFGVVEVLGPVGFSEEDESWTTTVSFPAFSPVIVTVLDLETETESTDGFDCDCRL